MYVDMLKRKKRAMGHTEVVGDSGEGERQLRMSCHQSGGRIGSKLERARLLCSSHFGCFGILHYILYATKLNILICITTFGILCSVRFNHLNPW